jgi:hypothetical protein
MEDKFVASQRASLQGEMKGAVDAALIKTGDRTYCFVGKWDDFESIAEARPQMIGILDGFRGMLEDLGGDLGLTDPVSGPAVVKFPAHKH